MKHKLTKISNNKTSPKRVASRVDLLVIKILGGNKELNIMGTIPLEIWIWDTEFYGKQLKRIFGNRKNYYKYIEIRKWNLWNYWLISLGYR